MRTENADDLVAFHHVRVIRAAALSLFCAIADKRVWLPRQHIKGHLWKRGDRGTLQIRRWVARERHLNDPNHKSAFAIVAALSAVPVGRPTYLQVLDGRAGDARGH